MGKPPKPASSSPSKATGSGKSRSGNGIVFRRYITLRNGKVLDAHDYGHKAWPIGKGR